MSRARMAGVWVRAVHGSEAGPRIRHALRGRMMCREPVDGIGKALGMARAIRELAGDALIDQCMPRPMAASLARTARDSVQIVQGVLDDFGTHLSESLVHGARRSSIDLAAVAHLAELAMREGLPPQHLVSLAHAMCCTLERAIEGLGCAQDVLRGPPLAQSEGLCP